MQKIARAADRVLNRPQSHSLSRTRLNPPLGPRGFAWLACLAQAFLKAHFDVEDEIRGHKWPGGSSCPFSIIYHSSDIMSSICPYMIAGFESVRSRARHHSAETAFALLEFWLPDLWRSICTNVDHHRPHQGTARLVMRAYGVFNCNPEEIATANNGEQQGPKIILLLT